MFLVSSSTCWGASCGPRRACGEVGDEGEAERPRDWRLRAEEGRENRQEAARKRGNSEGWWNGNGSVEKKENAQQGSSIQARERRGAAR